MKHHPMMFSALAILILPAGCDLAAQNAPAAEAETVMAPVQDAPAPASAPAPAPAAMASTEDGESSQLWLGLVQSMADGAAGTVRVEAPDALARELGALSSDMQAAAQIEDAHWSFSFAIDGAQALSRNGVYDFDRIDEIARPDTPAWCGRDAPYVVIDAAGVRRIWQQCSGTPPGEDAEIVSVRKFWIEDTMAGDYLWLDITATGSTDTGSELAALDAFSREALAGIAGSIAIFPAAGE